MAKRGRPAKKTGSKKATTKKVVAKVEAPVEKQEPVVKESTNAPKGERNIRFTGSHQICPRCGTADTVAYKSMDVDKLSNIRVQYRRCRRGHCRHEFKATLTVV